MCPFPPPEPGEPVSVVNLEFPYGVSRFAVGEIGFERLPDYSDRFKRMSSRVHHYGEHGERRIQQGAHVQTGIIHLPPSLPPPVLDHSPYGYDALDDVLLLLSLFTGRDVYASSSESEETGKALFYDTREYQWGGALSCSLARDARQVGEVDEVTRRTLGMADLGFAESLNEVYDRVRDPDWQSLYRGGRFLRQAQSAFRCQPLEATFVQCWTIWEHLFTVHNDSWMSDPSLRRTKAIEKVSFVLVHYGFSDRIDKTTRGRMESLVTARNRLVHYGSFPSDVERRHVYLFIRLTEFVLARILGLEPANLFNTIEELETFKSSEHRKNRE